MNCHYTNGQSPSLPPPHYSRRVVYLLHPTAVNSNLPMNRCHVSLPIHRISLTNDFGAERIQKMDYFL
ncbi:hypothetical protein H5410_024840 [Solanum commersonii]|uniref:Uncharacterized protein n=1 Tax=Solanum commersonii TaxID=4109 RepID=A0A9J5ZN91_SOLCO|nr:hypothetical protein H5410_024840 [Solanum commersonii]